ncbi:MAG: putative zinc-finger [Chthonomonadales bacterium]|nr:putative zinc-finger [Chthonomonadales bacterium]
MRCEEIRSLLDTHLDHELAEELNRRLERHLLRCAACSYEARTLEQTRSMLREAVPSAVPSPNFRERAVARLLDSLPELHPTSSASAARQWALPFSREDS